MFFLGGLMGYCIVFRVDSAMVGLVHGPGRSHVQPRWLFWLYVIEQQLWLGSAL